MPYLNKCTRGTDGTGCTCKTPCAKFIDTTQPREQAAIDLNKLREAFDAEGPNYRITVDRFKQRPDDYKFEQASQLWKFVQAIAARGGFATVAAPEGSEIVGYYQKGPLGNCYAHKSFGADFLPAYASPVAAPEAPTLPDSRPLHIKGKLADEPVDEHDRYFFRLGWNAFRNAVVSTGAAPLVPEVAASEQQARSCPCPNMNIQNYEDGSASCVGACPTAATTASAQQRCYGATRADQQCPCATCSAERATTASASKVCTTCGGSKVDPGGLPICRECGKAEKKHVFGEDCPVGMVQVEFVGCSPSLRQGEYGWAPTESANLDVWVDGRRYNIQVGTFHDGMGERRGLHIVGPIHLAIEKTSSNAASIWLPTDRATAPSRNAAPLRERYIKDMEDTLAQIGEIVGVKDDADKLIATLRAALTQQSAAQAPSDKETDALNGGMHASIFVKVWGDAGGGDAGRIALANYAYDLGKRAAQASHAGADTERNAKPNIPAGVCYEYQHDNFYGADGKGMGTDFYLKWRDLRNDFPQSRAAMSAATEQKEKP